MPKSKPKSEPMASMRDIDDDHLNLPSMLESNSGVHELFEHLPDASELVHDSGIPQASRKKVPRQTFALSIRTIATNKHQQSDEADKAAITSKVAEPADNTSATKPITLASRIPQAMDLTQVNSFLDDDGLVGYGIPSHHVKAGPKCSLW